MRPKIKTWNGEYLPYAHLKRDGNYLEVRKNSLGLFSCWTSHPHDITNQVANRIITPGMRIAMPCGCTLLGELWFPGEKASAVKHRIKEGTPLRFDCFAVQGLPASLRLDEVETLCTKWGVPFIDYLTCEKVSPSELVKMSLPPDVEGYVFKRANLLGWYKWKPVRTIDLVIRGFKEGNGKFLGLTGALVCCTAEGYEVASVSGMDDLTRVLISDDEISHLGKVVEVEYQYIGNRGRLRHPRFKQFRDDKEAQQCLSNQDPSLAEYWNAQNH